MIVLESGWAQTAQPWDGSPSRHQKKGTLMSRQAMKFTNLERRLLRVIGEFVNDNAEQFASDAAIEFEKPVSNLVANNGVAELTKDELEAKVKLLAAKLINSARMKPTGPGHPKKWRRTRVV